MGLFNYFQLGEAYNKTGQYKKEKNLYLRAEKDFPDNLFLIYEQGLLAEDYYREALSMEPEKPSRLNDLAWFLIDNNRNLAEGMDLADKALKLSPDNHEFLHTKGWGLYKQGKYREGLLLLQKSWDLRKKNAVYFHPASLHLEAAKKAVAGQK